MFIGFTTWFARLAERLVPERAAPEGVIIEPEFLDEAALSVPSVALENARLEIHRAGTITLSMMDALDKAFAQRDIEKIDEAVRRDDEVDILEAEIMKYLGHIRQTMLTEDESRDHQALMTAMTNLESLAGIMESDMVGVVKTYMKGEYQPGSVETQEMVQGLWQAVHDAVQLAVQAVGKNDQRAAQEVLLMKDKVRELADRLFERHATRLRADDPKYLERVRLLMTFIEQLRHMYTLAKRVARTHLPVEVAAE